MKGLKNIADNKRTKLIALENENDYLKDEIDKLECELLKRERKKQIKRKIIEIYYQNCSKMES